MASIGPIRHVSLTVNCGFARVAIRELTPCSRKCLKLDDRTSKLQYTKDTNFLSLMITLSANVEKKHQSQFNRDCEKILKGFATKWHLHNARKEYEQHFSISKWNALSVLINQATPSPTVLHASHNSIMTNRSSSHSNQFSSHYQC